ncbi:MULTISPECIES: tRNA-(ms[2]io[6]A)-hydroxylase [Pseudoalteromonas]|uniref:tRNA-(Ms[2]io[6]A)-hydroxylase n=4 Tax=Pseudoalteromonas TaxID=53246 RepID=Q3IGM6_PSET1|nr:MULTISPECIES: tRNA-(ms[2]io[6]A)-hydroxylase [Pseudoalteromonas]ALS33082.1 tRNA-(ms[2]io[6]A)-hydroxylase [Pseudoalteromonas translucida KMM 520]ASM54123.1 tRNA-(ms[2]io[6]A)-hydroxylase [Pseudoalteromonas nigrifaciens]MBB1369612.1 tRNA-(ms[2]io[6]A)-hydroxylase [Pseudoalteromonas sp. SR45-4]MBB1404839.1 tRNA-(ms[2]io[6]A)-hydroxylase [Pseudoalteromonas sp. SG44-5]MBE0419927.1 tRNA-(ms[2]io[6]A)-hydroxylase [Pseudoalteromonas nigrifaciens]|tara:strand:+ start:13803 stop:14375 length:573 start_codon:yes stop_codon:yes gene_type:complete
MFELKYHTPFEWTEVVLDDFDTFLQDHAAAEKKASGMAMSMLSHYPDKRKLVTAMADLALEEMIHFKEVLKILISRDVNLGDDKKDPYIKQIRALFRHGRDGFLMDRLLVGGVIEARGHERFSLVAQALPEGKEKEFYIAIAESEEKHKNLFVELAYEYFDKEEVDIRLEELLIAEAKICESIPFTAALH